MKNKFKITITDQETKNVQTFFCNEDQVSWTMVNDVEVLPNKLGELVSRSYVSKGFSFNGNFRGYEVNKNYNKDYKEALEEIYKE